MTLASLFAARSSRLNVQITTAEPDHLDLLADQLRDDAWFVGGWIYRVRRPRLVASSPNF